MGRGGELFLPPFGLCRAAAGPLRGASRVHHAREIPQRDHRFREARAVGSVDQPHHLRLGRAGSRRSPPCDVRVGRRADQLHHGDRLSRRRPAGAFLAGGRPCHRQGHHALPCDLLAGFPDVGAPRHAPADRRARLPVQPRGKNVEVDGQHRRPRGAGGALRRGSDTAISSCAKSRSDRTAIIRTRRSSSASTPISPTTSAISPSARCR